MILLVVSDFHIGKGKFLKNGQINVMEDFHEDERFLEMISYYSTGDFYAKKVHLVLNGDILNLIAIDHYGVFSHVIDEPMTIKAINNIYNGHKLFFRALGEFLSAPNKKITYVIGNHDSAMYFKNAQKCFSDLVGHEVDFADNVRVHGVHIEHGHRFDPINTVPRDQIFLEDLKGQKILNYPWGSLFAIMVLPRLKKERPYVDKVRPMNSYIKWCFFHDISFFLKSMGMIFKSVIEISIKKGFFQHKSIWSIYKLFRQVAIYPRYGNKARRIMKRKPFIHTVIMGHSHLREWRRFPEGKVYVNSGTWTIIPSVDVAQHPGVKQLSYVYVDVHDQSGYVNELHLNSWQGQWSPYRSEQIRGL
jgi:UDP-2,3-diacylglucosamine pyrophosphatase LpxH